MIRIYFDNEQVSSFTKTSSFTVSSPLQLFQTRLHQFPDLFKGLGPHLASLVEVVPRLLKQHLSGGFSHHFFQSFQLLFASWPKWTKLFPESVTLSFGRKLALRRRWFFVTITLGKWSKDALWKNGSSFLHASSTPSGKKLSSRFMCRQPIGYYNHFYRQKRLFLFSQQVFSPLWAFFHTKQSVYLVLWHIISFVRWTRQWMLVLIYQ